VDFEGAVNSKQLSREVDDAKCSALAKGYWSWRLALPTSKMPGMFAVQDSRFKRVFRRAGSCATARSICNRPLYPHDQIPARHAGRPRL
jgi:hypothetical protein